MMASRSSSVIELASRPSIVNEVTTDTVVSLVGESVGTELTVGAAVGAFDVRNSQVNDAMLGWITWLMSWYTQSSPSS